MNLPTSRSYSNFKDLRAVQPFCHGHPFDGYHMTPEQAIAENHYDVPRPTKRHYHRRSNSCSESSAWRIQLHSSSSTGTSSPTGITNVQHTHSVSAPNSPILERYGIMSSRDHSIYQSLGTSSSKSGKVKFERATDSIIY